MTEQANSDKNLATAAADLIHAIDDAEVQGALGGLRNAAQAHTEEPLSVEHRDNLGTHLHDALEHFESDHPVLTKAINDVAYYLSGLGL